MDQRPTVDANGIAYLTNAGQRPDPDFLGQQIARLNYNEAAAVPEAQTWV